MKNTAEMKNDSSKICAAAARKFLPHVGSRAAGYSSQKDFQDDNKKGKKTG